MADGQAIVCQNPEATAGDAVTASAGFPPIARADARILVLGSLPGRASLAADEYYAHPRNAFWTIMGILCGADGSYRERCERLAECRIAVWDVLANSIRPGSMDADIQLKTATPNDFAKFSMTHRQIELVCFNGKKAAQLFRKFVTLDALKFKANLACLPSTSPAYASLSFEKKLSAWRNAIVPADLEERR